MGKKVSKFLGRYGFWHIQQPSKMTKPEVLGILGLDVGDKWAYGCLLGMCESCLEHMLAI